MTLLTIISMLTDSPGLTPVPGPGATAATASQELPPQCTEDHPAADTRGNIQYYCYYKLSFKKQDALKI